MGPELSVPAEVAGVTTRLTPHETRVARMAAAGRYSREIATEFHISVRGVEFHLTNIYRKLGITRRIELAVVVASGQLV